MAIDRTAICERILGAGQMPAYRFTPPGLPGYSPPSDPSGGPEQARALLAEAGFPGGVGFPEIPILFNTSETPRQIAEAIQQMWKRELGISVRLENQEYQTYLDSRAQRNFSVARAVWIGDYVDAESFLGLWTQASGNNFSGWSDPAYDASIEQARHATDPAARALALQEAENRLLKAAPIIPLYFYVTAYLLDPRLSGWHPTPLDWHPYKYLGWAEEKATAHP